MPEKVKLDKELPEKVCVSALCDCGRHKSQPLTLQPREKGSFPESDYMLTYKAVPNPKPRSSKRPRLVLREPFLAPMLLSTNQRDEFKHPGIVEKVQPIVHADRFEPSTQPLDGISYYAQEFTPKQIDVEAVKQHKTRAAVIQHEAPAFDGTTMNKEHFKRWVPQPSLAFGELPSFADSILFPRKERLPQSTMKQSFLGAYTPSAVLMKGAPDNLKLEGDQAFDTTHSLTYRQYEGDHRVSRPLAHSDTLPLKKLGQFVGISQTKTDFPGYRGNQPRPPRPVDPPQPKINLKMDNTHSFTTENRSKFAGHNVTEHPVSVSFKKEKEEYKFPSVKFETETSQKRDYKPIDLKTVPNVHVKVPASAIRAGKDVKFDGRTTNGELFQSWRIKPRIRYGDFHENRPYIPSQEVFSAQSVTKTSFVPKPVEQRQILQPKQSSVSTTGEMSFTTEYQDEFQKKHIHVCPAAVFLLQQKLKEKRAAAEYQQLQQLQNKVSSVSKVPSTRSVA